MIGRRRGMVWLLVVTMFGVVMWAPASFAENRCVGGGKPRPDEGGIGGTGNRPVMPDEDDSGIGGTGISANGDTGIIGTITGFASICVGGVEVHYDAASSVDIDGEAAPIDRLAVGQVVEVVAAGTGEEVTAKQIAVHHIVVGPITNVDTTNRMLEVVGQKVTLDSANTETYEIGTSVQVSGLRRGDGIIASSLITKATSEVVHLTGPIAHADAGVVSIGDTRVETGGDVTAAVGEHVRIAGRWDGNQIVATSVQAQPRIPFEGRVSRVEIEGFATSVEGGRIQLGTYVFEGAPSGSPVAPDAPIRVHAMIRDHRAVIDHIGPGGARPPRPNLPEGAHPHGGGNPNGIPQLGVDPTGRDFGGEPHERPEPAGAQPMEARPQAVAPNDARPQRPEHPDRPDRPEMTKPERPPRVERPEPVERPVMPERPPRPERPEPPRRP